MSERELGIDPDDLELGRGGMGTVYLAERADGLYRQQVALELASPVLARPEAMERFCTERQVLARLEHPNIARLLDDGLAPDRRPYFVMELIDGAPITQWCTSHRLSVVERLRLFRVVCGGPEDACSLSEAAPRGRRRWSRAVLPRR